MAQFDHETPEIYRASSDAFADSIRLAVTVAMLAADIAVERRQRRLAQELAAAEERARIAADRLRAERAAAEPVLRAVHQERFWRDADPRRIGRAWQAAGEWADSDPYAAYTLEMLREQLQERFGIEVPQWTAGGPELARIVTVANPRYQSLLEKARSSVESSGDVSYAVLVRDLRDPYRIVYQGEVRAPAGMPAEAVAAREYARWASSPDAAEAAGSDGQFAVELVENTGRSAAAQTPAAQVRGDQAAQVVTADEAWQRALISGAEQGSEAELLYALTSELDRLEADEKLRLGRRAEYVKRLDQDGLNPRDRARLEGNVKAIDGGLTGLHQQQAETALRMAATVATTRGENPQHVYDAARLTDSLDDGWWQTASAHEIAGVWEHVGQWTPGQAREETAQFLREGVERHHGLMVPKDATPEMVGALFGGRDVPGAATPLTRQADALRDQAMALYEEAFDAFAEGAEIEHHSAQHSTAEAEEMRGLLEVLDLRAEASSEHAAQLMQQATWLEEHSHTAVARIYQENSGSAVATLAAEYEQRWGQPLGPEALQQLADTAAQAPPGAGRWAVVEGTGSVNPASITVIPGQVVRAAESSGPDPEEAARVEREAARRTDAQEALEGMGDREAVDAVQLARQAFPEGPEQAVARPPQTSRSGGGPGQESGRQRAPQVEL